jgi:hypothetical protein
LVGSYVVQVHYLVRIDIDPHLSQCQVFQPGRVCAALPRGFAEGGGPITTAEIVASIIAAKGLPENLAANLPEKTLTYLRGKLAAGTAKNSA